MGEISSRSPLLGQEPLTPLAYCPVDNVYIPSPFAIRSEDGSVISGFRLTCPWCGQMRGSTEQIYTWQRGLAVSLNGLSPEQLRDLDRTLADVLRDPSAEAVEALRSDPLYRRLLAAAEPKDVKELLLWLGVLYALVRLAMGEPVLPPGLG